MHTVHFTHCIAFLCCAGTHGHANAISDDKDLDVLRVHYEMQVQVNGSSAEVFISVSCDDE